MFSVQCCTGLWHIAVCRLSIPITLESVHVRAVLTESEGLSAFGLGPKLSDQTYLEGFRVTDG